MVCIQATGPRPREFVPNPVLANPDEIMPKDCCLEDLQADINAVQTLLDFSARKKTKYVNLDIRLDFSGPGQKTMLVSNYIDHQ